MSKYTDFILRKIEQYGERFSSTSLDPRFKPYYESGQRIKVDDHGQVFTGTVGVTTGWRPVFILLRTKRSTGSSIMLTSSTKIIAEQRGREYVPLAGRGDYRVENHGSLVLIRPITSECRVWLAKHTDGQWFAGALVVEPRYLDDLLEGLSVEGFVKPLKEYA